MQEPLDLGTPMPMEDEWGNPLNDFALSDACSFVQKLHKTLGYPRVMLLSDEVFDLLTKHPQILAGIGDGWLDPIAGTLLFKALDLILISDSRVHDCRTTVKGLTI